MSKVQIILDANILIRMTLGKESGARQILSDYYDLVDFLTPHFCWREFLSKIEGLARRRNLPWEQLRQSIETLSLFIIILDTESYELFETEARERLIYSDHKDWPLVAAALALQADIWSEDNDLYGTGIACWKTATIRIWLERQGG